MKMIKLKLCDDKRYIIQMLPDFERGRGRILFKSSFGCICTNLYPDSYERDVFVWGKYNNMDCKVVVTFNGNLKRDLKIYEVWAESINERFVVCLS